MDITDWQLWLDLFSTSDRRPGVFSTLMWSPVVFFMQTPFLLGIVFFAFTFVRSRSWVTLPAAGSRTRLLTRMGVAGPIALLAVASVCSTIVALFPWLTTVNYFSGAWLRAAVPFTLVAVLGITLLLLSREPKPPVGERAILPRRQWNVFAPPMTFTVVCVIAALYFCSELWQALAGSEPRELHSVFGGERVLKNVGGAPPSAMGWENHGASLIGLFLVLVLLVWILAADARRTVSSMRPFAEVKAERAATAQLVTRITLGGVLLALGAVWLNTWAPTTGYVPVEGGLTGENGDMLISHFHGLVAILRRLGWVAQGLGAAILLRLCFDTLRASKAARSVEFAAGPHAPQQTRDIHDTGVER